MLKKVLYLFLLLNLQFLFAQYQVTRVDFLKEYDLNFNAAGPILTQVDSLRNRITVLHTNASMVSIIDGQTNLVTNIPISSRGIQHLKNESFTLDQKSGVVYVLGNRCLHVVYPLLQTSKTFKTKRQYEMVAVDENTGNAFLVGRESKDLALINLKKDKISYTPWVEKEEALINLNQTPPPPIRKVVCDPHLNKVFAVDGYSSTLMIFDAQQAQLLNQRKMDLLNGARWHYAGYNKDSHHLYLVIENDQRQVIQAAKIDVQNGRDQIVDLPKFTEGVGINYNHRRDEIYIPYDNHASVHVVDFKQEGLVSEIKIPLYGNDASAIDFENDRLYIASWAYGEIEVIDLKIRKFMKRIPNLGILPHMFNLSYNPVNKKLYVPIGATAVNGAFGSAITMIDPQDNRLQKIYCGWAPKEMIQLPGKDEFLVFNAEDACAYVQADGTYKIYDLPFDYPHQTVYTMAGNIYLSYGPHQSYWPTVYIWGAKNGLLHIDTHTFEMMDRRLPRLAQEIVVDSEGTLYALQNNWGKEKQFISVFEDEIREFDVNKRIVLESEINRETIQRLLKCDPQKNYLYLVKVGETDIESGTLQIIDLANRSLLKEVKLGLNPTDLIVNQNSIYISNFDSNTLTKVNKESFETEELECGKHPLKMVEFENQIYILNHGENSLQRLDGQSKFYSLPAGGWPNNIAIHKGKLVITSHSAERMYVYFFDPKTACFELVSEQEYPYGETSFATNNNSFYLSGQFGDVIYEITQIKSDNQGRLWISDFLSGKLFIIKGIE